MKLLPILSSLYKQGMVILGEGGKVVREEYYEPSQETVDNEWA